MTSISVQFRFQSAPRALILLLLSGVIYKLTVSCFCIKDDTILQLNSLQMETYSSKWMQTIADHLQADAQSLTRAIDDIINSICEGSSICFHDHSLMNGHESRHDYYCSMYYCILNVHKLLYKVSCNDPSNRMHNDIRYFWTATKTLRHRSVHWSGLEMLRLGLKELNAKEWYQNYLIWPGWTS